MAAKPEALIVEDRDTVKDIVALVEEYGFQAQGVRTGSDALEYLKADGHRLDLLVMDLHLQRAYQGWTIIADVKGELPYWCKIAVLTADPSTRPAAPSASVKFYEKGTLDDDEFEHFLEEHAKGCTDRLHGNSPYCPSVVTDKLEGKVPEDLIYTAVMMCKAITDVSTVDILQPLEGSFQDGIVLQVQLVPRDNAPRCVAVVKCGDLTKARKEFAGQSRLLWYFSKIGMSLPPLRQYQSLLSARELVLVTPFADGQTLSSLAKERWYADSQSRTTTFESIFKGATLFLESIQQPRDDPHGVALTFAKAYLSPDASSKREKTIPVLEGLIGTSADRLACVKSKLQIPNPLLLFNGVDGSKGWRWMDYTLNCTTVTYSHGDFHTGNLMVRLTADGQLEPDGLTVLDYDYVDENCCHYDRAQLESSFLLQLALVFDDHCGPENWESYFLPALSVLTSKSEEASIENNEFAKDLVRVVKALRGDLTSGDLKLYYGALLTTLLRVSVSNCEVARRRNKELSSSAKRSIIITLGLLLDQLIAWEETKGEPTTVEVQF